MRERHSNFRYAIIGDGPLKDSLATIARDLNIADLVHFHGAQDTTFIQRAMAESHLFLLPSVTASDGDQEGTPVSILEAQAAGLPVVSTLHAGIPEIVGNGESGFLVPEKDPSALAERLIYLMEHPEQWPILGKTGRKRMETAWNMAQLNQDLVALYRKVIDAHFTVDT